VLLLAGAFDRHTGVIGLLPGELREFYADALLVQAGDFLVGLLGQAIDTDPVGVAIGPEIQLREALVGETVAHHEARMAGGAAEIHEAAFGQQVNRAAIRQHVFVDTAA
jgi:hypothetical protein